MLWAVVIFFTILLVFEYYKRWELRQLMPTIPNVSEIPLIGSSIAMISFKPENMHLKFHEYVVRYGKTFYARPAARLVINTADIRYVEDILQSQKHLHKSSLYIALRPWLGNGLLLSHGSQWQVMRKIITPTFHFKILEEFVEVYDRQSTIFVEKMKEFADGTTTVNIFPCVGLLTLDVIAETAMGVRVNAQINSKSDFVVAVKEVTNILATRFIRPHLLNTTMFRILTPGLYKRAQRGIKITHDFTAEIIAERRGKLHTKTVNHDKLDEDDVGIKRRVALLDMLLQSTIEGAPLSDRQICDEVNTFMFEGHDTTNSAVAFCLYLLSRHPECQTKLFDEIRAHFGDDLQRPITHSDLLELNYLNCVVKESLRLYPPVPAIGRFMKDELQLVDGTIPAGSNVFILLWELLRDPDVFDNPTSFRPERFLEENPHMKIFSNIPFSAGPRNCIGQRFALFEIKTIVIKTLRNFELLAMGEDVQPSIKITLNSQTGVNMGFTSRIY